MVVYICLYHILHKTLLLLKIHIEIFNVQKYNSKNIDYTKYKHEPRGIRKNVVKSCNINMNWVQSDLKSLQ